MVKYKIFTVPALEPEWGEEELNSFLAAHKTVSVDKHFIQLPHSAYWSFVVSYMDSAGGAASNEKRPSVDYREVLSADDFSRFVKLRELRNRLAKEESKPAYAIFTNEQLAKMVQERVTEKTTLADIEGIGQGRMEQYAEIFLPLLRQIHTEPAQ